mgnify:CR=1 FL=1|jgi:hypothetical protein|tara:strand:+ start:277 stop:396 length:120 start_codon:yes stop_codon:yes gene_type:complete
MELLEDAPTSFFKEFYLTVCEHLKVDPDALFLSLMEDET